jgi:hypothetical protein
MQRVFPALLLLFDPEQERKREERVAETTRERAEEDHRILCAACRNAVTHRDERIGVNGSHSHTCCNPHGFVFTIGCFRAASGCRCTASATAEHSWFPGYEWSIAYCAQCDRHLGWRFVAAADCFYGLILDRLSEPLR